LEVRARDREKVIAQLDAEKLDLEVHACDREKVIAQLRAHAHELEDAVKIKDGKIIGLQSRLADAEAQRDGISHQVRRLEHDLEQNRQDRVRELASLKRNDFDERLPPELTGWRWIAPGRRKKLLRLIKDYRLIAASPLFDSRWYLANNPDVAVKPEDPALHYLLQGGLEGRAPGPRFDGRAYLQANPDVANSQSNPLLHYIRQGHKENR